MIAKLENLNGQRPEQERVPSGAVPTGSWEGSFTQSIETFTRPLDSISGCHWSLKPSNYLFQRSHGLPDEESLLSMVAGSLEAWG